jgi:hypothetical protein
MLEVRYTSKPTPVLLLAVLALVCSVWEISRLIYSLAIFHPPTSELVIKLLGWLAALVFGVTETLAWFRRRNVAILQMSTAGVWTAKTGLLSWESVKLKVGKWHDVVSITYNDAQGTHLQKWNLTDLNINASELIKAKVDFNME